MRRWNGNPRIFKGHSDPLCGFFYLGSYVSHHNKAGKPSGQIYLYAHKKAVHSTDGS